MKERIWGLDLGTTSIGFAVVDHDSQEQSGQIIKMGVRIFPVGVTEKESLVESFESGWSSSIPNQGLKNLL